MAGAHPMRPEGRRGRQVYRENLYGKSLEGRRKVTQEALQGGRQTTTQPEQPLPISYADIEAAAERLRGQAHRTPVVTSRSFDAEAGIATFFKCEQFQRAAAFQFPGPSTKIPTLPPPHPA